MGLKHPSIYSSARMKEFTNMRRLVDGRKSLVSGSNKEFSTHGFLNSRNAVINRTSIGVLADAYIVRGGDYRKL